MYLHKENTELFRDASDKNYNHYDFYYKSVVGDRVVNVIPPFVKLETALMSYSFPTEEREIGNYLFSVLGEACR